MVSMLKNEGPLTFFSGLTPALLMAPAAMVQYTLMDPLRTMMPLFAAALIAGALDILIKCPFERLKTMLQGGEKGAVSGLLLDTWRASGLQGLYAGLSMTLARDLPYLMLKWLTYVNAQTVLAPFVESTNVVNLIAGAVAGAVAATVVTPADVIKTRLQIASKSSEKPSIWVICQELISDGGIPALFRGLGPRLLRIPVYTAITLATFDMVKDFFAAANDAAAPAALARGEL